MLHRVCSSDEINNDCMAVFTIDHTDILIGRRNGKLFACNNSCPHRGASLSKGEFNNNNIICYMHGYEFNIFTGKLEHMKSWKKEDTWIEQNAEWRKSGNLILYTVMEKNKNIYIEIDQI